MTTVYPALGDLSAVDDVYPPQEDSQLLIDTMEQTAIAQGRRVLDLCTGSGVVAIAAAGQGAVSVTAYDICPRAVRSARGNARDVGVDVDVREGPWSGAMRYAPFEVIVSNPPYVPTPPEMDTDLIASSGGPWWAWNAGGDGRLVLDPLCRSAAGMLSEGGSMLLVQSEFSGVQQSLESLRSSGLDAEVIASQWIPFGPVLSSRALWLERCGRLRRGRRDEQLVVIRADKP